MSNQDIQKTINIKTSPDKVFKAIIDEAELQKWWVDVPVLELHEGGNMMFRFLKEKSEMLDQDYVVKGKVIEVIPDKKLVYSWKPIDDPKFPDSIVTWTLESIDSDKTKVTLTHSRLEGCEIFALLDAGWEYFLKKLAKMF